jgi:CheY-like chemotaxis protein
MREPQNEAERLAALRRYGIVDSPPDPHFDELVALAAAICDAPIALIGCIERERVWLKARHGIDVRELPMSWLPAPEQRGLNLIADMSADARTARLPSVTGDPRWRFLAAAPIYSDDGFEIGVFAIVDVRRRRLTALQRSALEVLARQASALFELNRLQDHGRRKWAEGDVAARTTETTLPEAAGKGADSAATPIAESVFVASDPGGTAVRRRILVVDDVEAAATMLGRVLETMGHETRIAHDGPRAIAIAKEYHPDVILLDLGMPGMSGFVVARLLRAQTGLEGITLIAVTGHGRDEDRRQALEAGFDHHLLKPISAEHMRVLLAQLPARAE